MNNPLFGVRVDDDGERLTAYRPWWTFALRGVLVAVLAPPLLLLLAALIVVAADDPTLLAVILGIFGAGALIVVALGAMLAAVSPLLEHRSRVTVDRPKGCLQSRRAGEVSLDEVTAITYLSGFVNCRLEATRRAGPPIVLVVAGSGAASSLEAAAARLAEAAGCPLSRGGAPAISSNERLFGAACHLPLQGIFLFASVAALLTSKSPFVRFQAIQSLLHFVAFFLLVGLLLLVGVPLGLLLDGTSAQLVVVGILAAALGLLVLGNITVRIVALVLAYQGRVWVFPWVAPLVRRWAPDPLGVLIAEKAETFR